MLRRIGTTLVFFLSSLLAWAQEDTIRKPEDRFNLHFQTTYIYQYSGRFRTPYSGQNSLNGDEEKQNSLTLTLFGGARLWKGAEVYINSEIAGGSGLSGALGMGGSSNGETFRVGNPAPTLYLARAFFVQTFALGKGGVQTEDGANALNTFVPKDHFRVLIGKYSLGDLFDNNAVSNSPRSQFMNWSLMNTGAWDYAANVRGYTLAAATELSLNKMAYKLAAAALPEEANGDKLSTDFSKSISLTAEIDRNYSHRGKEGNLRFLLFYNKTQMGGYDDAVSLGNQLMDTPDVTRTRSYGREKMGFAMNADQQFSDNLSGFARVGWNDGKNETWCFTEIDQTIAIGAALKGSRWKRADDVVGLALVGNGLSKEHRNYLQKGGNGFILGDGSLSYAPETIAEIYYNCKVLSAGLWASADYQFCLNPGYNKDRGPASIASIRIHVEL